MISYFSINVKAEFNELSSSVCYYFSSACTPTRAIYTVQTQRFSLMDKRFSTVAFDPSKRLE